MSVAGSLAAEGRRQVLLDLLRECGRVDISGAAGQLGVHHMTIRRDLKGLEREGSARLVRGGAIFVGTEEFEIRQSRALSAKRRIAEKLGPLVLRHDSVAIDASTTLFQLAENMPAVDHLVVVTYGIAGFQALQARAGVRVFLSGGELDRRTGSLVGPVAQRTLEGFSLSCCLLSATALDPELGTMEPTVEEVEMKQAMVRASQHVVLAVDSTKLSQRSAVRALSLDQIQTVVTELDPADPRLDPYRNQVLLL
ncbi:MAG: DeoR/GlpR family DNA-binding transcription regulator [Actinomycetota bacterium]|nr:DeoR/GlpR family DNA-binding transcription regulator [Actinomycetota bacterium]